MEQTKNQRVRKVIESTGLSVNAFSKKAGVSQTTLASMLKRGTQPKDEIIDAIANAFNVSRSWLLTGEGEMLNDKKPAEQSAGLPLIPENCMAGALSGVGGQWMEYECEHYVIPGFAEADFLITVMGDSMQPTLASGDVLAVKRVEASKLWFQWGKIYVLATRQGCIVKRIMPSDKEGCVSIVSDNKSQYPAYDLEGDEINSIGLVIGLIRRF